MEAIDLKKSAIDFLEDTESFTRSAIAGSNVLLNFFEKNNPTATCEDLLNLEATTALKIKGFAARRYVDFCDELKKCYALPEGNWALFKELASVKTVLTEQQYPSKLSIKKKSASAVH